MSYTKQMTSKVKSVMSYVGAAVAAIAVSVSNASAALDVSTIVFDLSPLETLMLAILTGLAAIWVMRKLVKGTNRS